MYALRFVALSLLVLASCTQPTTTAPPAPPAAPTAVAVPQPSPAPPAPTKPPQTLENEGQLWAAYGANVVQSDENYTGAIVELKVCGGDPVQKDDAGRYYLAWRFGDSPATRCYIAPSSLAKLRDARPATADRNADRFRLRGYCVGRTSDPLNLHGYTVMLTDCEILAVLEWRDNAWAEKPPITP